VTPAGTVPVQIGSAVVATNGTWSVAAPLRFSGALVARFAGVTGQPPAQVSLGNVVAGTWSTTLSATASASSVITGGALTLTGSLTRSYGGVTEPAAGVQVRVWFQATGSTTRTLMTTATVSAAGAFSARVLPKVSGTWTVTVSGVPGYADASSASMPVSVS